MREDDGDPDRSGCPFSSLRALPSIAVYMPHFSLYETRHEFQTPSPPIEGPRKEFLMSA